MDIIAYFWKLKDVMWPRPRPFKGQFVFPMPYRHLAIHCTKFKVSSFSHSGDIVGGTKNLNRSRDHKHTHFGVIFYLARSAKLLTRLYILLVLISFLFLSSMISRRQIISGSAGPIFAIFHRIKAFWVYIIDLDLFFQDVNGRCDGNRFCEKWQTTHCRRCGI